jgi:hypothetical protein
MMPLLRILTAIDETRGTRWSRPDPRWTQDEEAMVWMREPFLSRCDEVACGRFIVHDPA